VTNIISSASSSSVPHVTTTVNSIPTVQPGNPTTSKPPGDTTFTQTIKPPPTTSRPAEPSSVSSSSSSTSRWTNIIPIEDTTTVPSSSQAPQTLVASQSTAPAASDTSVVHEADLRTTQTVDGIPTVSLYFTVTVTEKVHETVTATLILPG
jgi:hypothetical protein